MRNVVLIGFMGTGKTEAGRLLARRLGWSFIDTDALIEAREGRTIAEIFRDCGEPYFRDVEARATAEAARAGRAVIATGGGAVLREENRARLRASGWIVSLVAEPEVLLARVGAGVERPLLAGEPEANLRRLLSEREPLYRDADLVLDVSRRGVEDVVNRVVEFLAGYEEASVPVRLGSRSYAFHVGDGNLALLGWHLRGIGAGRGVALLTHPRLRTMMGNALAANLREWGFDPAVVTVPAGERSKGLRTASRVYDALVAHRCDRGAALVCLGGGVIGDLGGFVAATYMRGIALVHAPTTLLAQVDSSIGGKTAVNHPRAKNLIGAFYQPRLVAADIAALRSLPAREVRSGLAEIIKAAVIADADLFQYLEQHLDRILALEREILVEAIRRAAAIKAQVVEEDEFESHRRQVLNYGHTIGHAIEVATGYGRYAHGEAIAIGMHLEAVLAARMGLIGDAVVARQEALLARAGLPTRPEGVASRAVMEAMALDKKAREGRIRFALPLRLGEVAIRDDVPPPLVQEVLAGSPESH
ncbi:MAG: 3-dehydroquinate synthase [Armatimonadetes bacterium]|nr:3-dehydroquinate synthase [Armatimonadota bacterium]